MTNLTKDELKKHFKNLGIQDGDLINLKASLRSIGKIDGGANTLIDALLECVGSEGTIVTDSFVKVYSVLSFPFWRTIVNRETPSYAGALANAMIHYPNSFRSHHPVQKFCLIGKHARFLANSHTSKDYAYKILHEMCYMGGKNLKIGSDEKVPGVGTTHVAIGKSKLRQLRPRAGVRFIDENNKINLFFVNWSGGCSKAFYNLNKFYDNEPNAIISRGKIGNAQAKLSDMNRTLNLELKLIKNSAEKFICCEDEFCDCHYTWENIGMHPIRAFFKFMILKKYKPAIRALYVLLFYRFIKKK